MLPVLICTITACIFLIIYIFCTRWQLNKIKQQLDRRREEGASNPVSLEINNKAISGLTVSINETLRQESALRVSQEIKEREFKDLVANISHDLRTPLTVINGYLQLLNKNGLDKTSSGYLEVCLRHTNEMEKRLQQFLEYSYWAGRDEKIALHRVNVTNLITDVMAGFVPVFEENNIAMQLEDTTIYYGLADEGLLQRIMQNLLKNGLQYATGDVSVCIARDETRHRLNITVSNPVSKDCHLDTSKVFNRFYTGNAERNHSTGLGLSIVKLLAGHMGGGVYAELKENIFCAGFYIQLAEQDGLTE